MFKMLIGRACAACVFNLLDLDNYIFCRYGIKFSQHIVGFVSEVITSTFEL